MKEFALKTIFVATVLLQSCSGRVYNNKSFLKTSDISGKTVAVLPVEVEYTGRLPKNMTLEKKMLHEEEESLLIQNQLYSQYLFKARSGSKRRKPVELMNVDRVNSLLREKGISPRQSWGIHADSLGKLLGADLVLRVRVKENRIMSDAASLGIGVAANVLDNILTKKDNTNNNVTNVGLAPKTFNIYLSATLSDVKSHSVVTKFTHNGEANWNRSTQEVIDAQGRKIVRRGAVYAQQ